MIVGVVLLAAALVVAAFGVAIRSGYTQLIAGYESNRATDEDARPAFVGLYLVGVGAFMFLVGLLEAIGVFPDDDGVWILFAGTVFALAVGLALGTRGFGSTDG